jgi:hypothetical protein
MKIAHECAAVTRTYSRLHATDSFDTWRPDARAYARADAPAARIVYGLTVPVGRRAPAGACCAVSRLTRCGA